MKITNEMIDQARVKGACKPAMRWLTEQRRDVEDLIEHAEFLPWCFQHNIVPDEYLDQAAKACPGYALAYSRAKLSDEQFKQAALMDPACARAFDLARYNRLGLGRTDPG